MRFFVCIRDETSGNVRLIDDRTFATRADALAALQCLSAEDVAVGEPFVVDLETATPVIVLSPSSATAPERVRAHLLDRASCVCDDCIYEATCPRAGSLSPAMCPTFQWRPVTG